MFELNSCPKVTDSIDPEAAHTTWCLTSFTTCLLKAWSHKTELLKIPFGMIHLQIEIQAARRTSSGSWMAHRRGCQQCDFLLLGKNYDSSLYWGIPGYHGLQVAFAPLRFAQDPQMLPVSSFLWESPPTACILFPPILQSIRLKIQSTQTQEEKAILCMKPRISLISLSFYHRWCFPLK